MAQNKPGIDRFSLIFILVTNFLNFAGIGLLGPVSPFLVSRYLADPGQLALVNGWLFTSYSLCQFIAVPGLGALSDRFGRRPVLLLCLLGSAFGYLIFGLGGALWMLFLGRIIDGITGGNLGAIYAYVADLTEPQDRTRYYGMLGAVSGFAFVLGPALGGILAKAGGPTAPVFFAAIVSLINVCWGYFAMPESLKPENRSQNIKITQLNPFTQLIRIFRLPQLRWLLLAVLLWTLPFAALQSNLSVLGKDFLGAQPEDVSGIFAIVGVVGIIVQGGLIRVLLKRFSEIQIALVGSAFLVTGFALIGLVPSVRSVPLLIVGTLVFALGNSLFTPSITGLVSQSIGARDQGRVQGGSQSVQAVARVIGPLLGSAVYVYISAGASYFLGAILCGVAALCILAAVPAIRQAKAQRESAAPYAPPPSAAH